MKISELMTEHVVSLRQGETADTAARLLSRNNIGALPVCDGTGNVVGILTDRDLVTRCMAAGALPEKTPVDSIMSTGVLTAEKSEDAEAVALRMGRHQVRRMPVVGEGKLLGMVSLGDLARAHAPKTEAALIEISGNISRR